MLFFDTEKVTQLSRWDLSFWSFFFWKSCFCEFSAFVFFSTPDLSFSMWEKPHIGSGRCWKGAISPVWTPKSPWKKQGGATVWNASPLKKTRKKLILHHLFCLERKPQSTRRAPIVDNFQHHHRLYKIADVVTTSAQKWWPLSVKSQQHPKPNKMLGSCGVESIRCCFWETMAG